MRDLPHRCVLPYITWGLIQDPKTKGISKLIGFQNQGIPIEAKTIVRL